jgi:hypothetical protein
MCYFPSFILLGRLFPLSLSSLSLSLSLSRLSRLLPERYDGHMRLFFAFLVVSRADFFFPPLLAGLKGEERQIVGRKIAWEIYKQEKKKF